MYSKVDFVCVSFQLNRCVNWLKCTAIKLNLVKTYKWK